MKEETVFHLMEKMTFSELLEDFDPFEADLEKKAAELDNMIFLKILFLV